MPEWLLWVLFAVVLLPVAALCLVLIYSLVLSARTKVLKKPLVIIADDSAWIGQDDIRNKDIDF